MSEVDAAEQYRRMMDQQELVDAAIGKVVRAAVMLEQQLAALYVAVVNTSAAYVASRGRSVDWLLKETRRAAKTKTFDAITTDRLRLVLIESKRLLGLRNAVVHGLWAIDADASPGSFVTYRPRIGQFHPDVSSWDADRLLALATDLHQTARQTWDVSTNALTPGSPWDAWA